MFAGIFLEGWARPLLYLHLVVAGALVAVTTHHLVWAVRYLKGNFAKRNGERTLVSIAAALYLGTFALGNLIYPTYKIRVRAEYFDDIVTTTADARLRAEATGIRTHAPPPPENGPVKLGWVSHLFDVKEHWVALGLPLMLALWWMSRRIDLRENRAVIPVYVGLSALICVLVWIGASIGIWVASYRAIGAL